MTSRSKCKKKSFLILEVLIALAIMTLCLLPFISKASLRFLSLKNKAAYGVFAHDFEHRVCEFKERAQHEGLGWVQGKKEGETCLNINEPFKFEDLHLEGQVVGRITLKKIYKAKKDQKTIYRLNIDIIYKGKQLKKNYPFSFLVSLHG